MYDILRYLLIFRVIFFSSIYSSIHFISGLNNLWPTNQIKYVSHVQYLPGVQQAFCLCCLPGAVIKGVLKNLAGHKL